MKFSSTGALAAGLMLSGSVAWAIMPNPQCVQDARAEMQQCKNTCLDNFQVAKDMCRNVNHDCADACRAGRDTCVAGPLGALQTCLGGCNTTVDAAKADCRNQFPDRNDPQRDACIDAAQVTAFQCRDTCREHLDKAALKLCRQIFRSCIKACPAANQ